MKPFLTTAPAAMSAAGADPGPCDACACFDGDNSLSKPCETCTDCHACLLCSRDHEAPKNGACPTPRIVVRRTGSLWYAECPLTLTGHCTPRRGCRGESDLTVLHDWAMGHVAAHRDRFRQDLIRAGVQTLRAVRKHRRGLEDKGIDVLDLPAAPLAADAAYWETQREFREAVGVLAQFLVCCGEADRFTAAEPVALRMVRDEYDALEALSLSEAA